MKFLSVIILSSVLKTLQVAFLFYIVVVQQFLKILLQNYSDAFLSFLNINKNILIW
jgi:hypothetical protein